MRAEDWKNRILEAMTKVGTYKDEFLAVIDTLSEILEERDRVRQQFIDEGAQATVLVISDRGAQNYRTNPLMKQWLDLNDRCLVYWRELGLTPAGLKRITEETGNASMNPLEQILTNLEKGHGRKKVQTDRAQVRSGRSKRKDPKGK